MSDQELTTIADLVGVYDSEEPFVTVHDVVLGLVILITTYPLLVGLLLL